MINKDQAIGIAVTSARNYGFENRLICSSFPRYIVKDLQGRIVLETPDEVIARSTKNWHSGSVIDRKFPTRKV